MAPRADYDGPMAAVYDRGRLLAPDAMAAWAAVVDRHIRSGASALLDLGSGTGRFSGALSEWTGAHVIGVEPAAGMRNRARPHPAVAYVAGTAEAIPLRARSCGAAWLSNVVHHFSDLSAAAHELQRVLRAGSPALVRGYFPDSGGPVLLARWFPGAQAVADTFPTMDELTSTFGRAGLERVAVERVRHAWASSLPELRDKVALRADSTLVPLSDEEFAAGLRALDRDAAGRTPAPVVADLDLLVLRRV